MNPSIQTLRWLPQEGDPQQLFLLFHGVGANAADMAPLAEHLRAAFPQSGVMAFDGFEPFDGLPQGEPGNPRQWFSIQDQTEDTRRERLAPILPWLKAVVESAQQSVKLGPQATALVGFSQGAIAALELIQRHDGLAGRVMAFSGRYASLPTEAPQHTTLHFFHGAQDPVIEVRHAREAMQRLADVQGDATIDIADQAGHEITGELLQRALHRLRSHIPHRSWRAAMGQVEGLRERDDAGEDPA